MRRMMLTDASCPSKSAVAVTNRILFVGMYGAGFAAMEETAFMDLAPTTTSGFRPDLRRAARGAARAGAPACCGARRRLRKLGGRRELGARGETEIEDAHERLRDLGRRHRLILAIPVRDPVQSTGECERAHLQIMRLDRAIARALLEKLPDGMVDLGLEFLDARKRGRREPEVLGAHHASAELGRNGLRVMANGLIQLLAGAHPRGARPTKRRQNALEAGQDALEQELLFVGHVIVNRGLGDVQSRRDLVDGGVVIAAFTERAGRGPDHRLTLDVAGTLARIAHGPR